MTQRLPDIDSQARADIRDLIDETFLVEAGAGTGKTSALVERVVSLVVGGRRIERLVAITFTDKAASELRDRVRSALEAAREDSARGPDELALLDDALSSLDRAHLSTIHAFCQTLLRQFAPELGVDPAFEVQDEVLAGRRFEEMWRLYLDRLGTEQRAVQVVNRALDLGLTTSDIANLAASLWKQPELAPLLKAAPLVVPPPDWPDLAALRAPLAELALAGVPHDDRLKPLVEALIASLDRLIAARDDKEAHLFPIVAALPRSYNVGRQDNWGREWIERARTAAQAAAEALRATLGAARSAALSSLLSYVVDFVVLDSMARGREGKLVFDDLILRTRELLRDRPAARSAIRERFDCLLIDEFQDTDPLQVDIARAFAMDPVTGHFEPGRLFLVGDPKQSIYRFRRADMAVYAATRSRLESEHGRLPELRLNRRSRKVIVDWVNSVFGGIIGRGEMPDLQPPYRPIAAERDAELRGPGVAWFGGALDSAAREVRRREAEAVAGQIEQALREAWEVQDCESGDVRGAIYRDIAVLVPARTILRSLERALQDAGIPYRVEGGSLVYSTQEVRDVINCLAAIDDPADEVAIVGALRSPAFACSDVELAAFRLDGGRFDYLRPDLDAREGRVADGLRTLRVFHRSRHDRSLAALVERFLADRALVEVGMLDEAGRNSFRRARFTVEQARSFEAAGPESLRAFVTWLERRAGRAVLDNEGAGLDDDEDAVRILTIHGAKGLEFPIVMLAGLGSAPGNERRVFGLDRETGDIAVALGSRGRGAEFTLGPVDRINNQETQHLRAERDRLLYVAATRARDHLVVSLHHKAEAADSAAARLIAAGALDGAVEYAPATSIARGPRSSLATLEVDSVESPKAFVDEREGLVSRARTLRFTSATALGPVLKRETSDETEPWARGRGGTHVGRAVHASLQAVHWNAPEDEVEAIASAQAVAEAVPDRAGEIAGLVNRALASDAAGRARAAKRTLREVPFALPFNGVLVEGFADVIIDGDEGIEIVDWKTDEVSETEAPERLRDYELQAGLYVLGLAAATGRRVQRVTYVFIRPGLELSPGDPSDLAARARDAIDTSPGAS